MTEHVDSRARGPHTDSRVNVPQDSRIRVQGHSVEDVKNIVRQVLLEENYRGEPGKDSVVPGPKVQISIGRVVAGESASAILREDGDNQVLDLVLPRGPEGKPGRDSNVQGPAGSPGVGAPGRDGKDAPSLEQIRVMVEELLASEEIRNIFKGATGEVGCAGVAATVRVGTTTTVSAGTPASVVNAGTANAVVLNFSVPQGATGATGATGASVEGPEGRPGKNPDKQDIQEIVIAILKRNNLIR